MPIPIIITNNVHATVCRMLRVVRATPVDHSPRPRNLDGPHLIRHRQPVLSIYLPGLGPSIKPL